MKDLAIQLTNRPGDLARVAAALAHKSVNIKSLAATSAGDVAPRARVVITSLPSSDALVQTAAALERRGRNPQNGPVRQEAEVTMTTIMTMTAITFGALNCCRATS